MQVFRKHQKGILIGIVLFIGVPMLFFGLPGFGGGGGNQYGGDQPVAVVGGIPVMASDYLGYLDIAAERVSVNMPACTSVSVDSDAVALGATASSCDASDALSLVSTVKSSGS